MLDGPIARVRKWSVCGHPADGRDRPHEATKSLYNLTVSQLDSQSAYGQLSSLSYLNTPLKKKKKGGL